MKMLRLIILAASFAAFLFIASPAIADCSPEDPDCPITPPQSVEVNSASVDGEGSTSDVQDTGAVKPLEISPASPAFIDPVPFGSASGGTGGNDGSQSLPAALGTSEPASSISQATAWVMAAIGAAGIAATASSVLGRGSAAPIGSRFIPGISRGVSPTSLAQQGMIGGTQVASGGPSGAIMEGAGSSVGPSATGEIGVGGDRRRDRGESGMLPTPSPTPTPSSTPTPSATPTPYSQEWLERWEASVTPGPTETPIPGIVATQIARSKRYSSAGKSGLTFFERFSRATGGRWPSNYQWTGTLSAGLGIKGLIREEQGASEEELWGYKTAGKSVDSVGTYLMANLARTQASLPSAGRVLRQTLETALRQQGLRNKISSVAGGLAQGFSDELTALGAKVIPPIASGIRGWFSVAVRGLQAVGGLGGIVGGVFQAKDGLGMLENDTRRDDWVGRMQIAGGVATTTGAAITVIAAIGGLSTLPVLVGAAPVLLGVGAIAAVGALVYYQLKDKELDKKFEDWANKPGGFSDTAINVGRWVKRGLDAPKGIAQNLSTIVTVGSQRVRNTARELGDSVRNAASTVVEGAIGKLKNLFGKKSEAPSQPRSRNSTPARGTKDSRSYRKPSNQRGRTARRRTTKRRKAEPRRRRLF